MAPNALVEMTACLQLIAVQRCHRHGRCVKGKAGGNGSCHPSLPVVRAYLHVGPSVNGGYAGHWLVATLIPFVMPVCVLVWWYFCTATLAWSFAPLCPTVSSHPR